MTGGEAILHDGKVVSLACSGGYGYSVGQTIVFGYLPVDLADKTEFGLELFGERRAIRRVDGPLYDPTNARLKA